MEQEKEDWQGNYRRLHAAVEKKANLIMTLAQISLHCLM